MHYLDKEQLASNYLEVVVYFHEYKLGNIEFGVEIASIQKCQYFSPRLLQTILKHPKKLYRPSFEFENWYRLRMKQIDQKNWAVTEVETVTNSNNEFHRLH